MAIKGETLSAETRAKMSAAHKARWEKINAIVKGDRAVGVGPNVLTPSEQQKQAFIDLLDRAAELKAIEDAHPRCRKSRWQRFIAWLRRK